MAKESPADTPPPPSALVDSYIGSLVSVMSKSEIRYEGILYYLNLQDSTLGLKHVRSYGTEGRKKNGPQVPPSDRVYEYILFRGKDIKDLQVKTSPSVQMEEAIDMDPAIIRATELPSSLLKSVPASNVSLTEFNLNSGTSPMNATSYPSILPSHFSTSQMGIWSSSTTTQSALSSDSLPTQWKVYSGTPVTTSSAQQNSMLPNSMLYNVQNTHPSTLSNVSSPHLLATSSSVYLCSAPILTPEKHSTLLPDSLSSGLSPPFNHSTLMNSNGLTMPFPFTYPSMSSVETPVFNKAVCNSQSSPYQTSYVSHTVSEPLFKKLPPLLTPNQISQPSVSENPSPWTVGPDPKDIGDMKSMSPNFSSLPAAAAVQPPLLPLPPASQKLQNLSQFTEEFDFQAMNEKFKKEEVWGYLGKANQKGNIERALENGTSKQDTLDDNPGLVTNAETKCAYNKDDFFDSISCNSIGRGTRNGQNRLSERMKLDSETFGTFRQRTQLSYNGHGPGRGHYHGAYNRGRGYEYGNRGRGAYVPR